ncbi:MAG: hypothetical protein EA393_16635 [Bacteroidetes bacterium]|nr:MAG: hypothetical protein EA393_16635 [Bacteroidota bacterium]
MKTNFKPIILVIIFSLPMLQAFAELPEAIDQRNTSKVFKLELIFNSDEIFEEELNFDTRVIVNIFNAENKIEKEPPFDIRYFIKPEKEVEEPEIKSMFNHRILTTESILTTK